jgi:CPA1 family monovalent cation:H+ antiporter
MVVLVLAGLMVGTVGLLPHIRPSGQLILLVFLPALLFEASLSFDPEALRRVNMLIVVLAVPGLIVSALIIGCALSWLLPITLAAAVVFGAFISATDPVAVVGIFRRLGVARTLIAAMEGESVLNDGTAVALAAAVLPAAIGEHFNLPLAAVQFVVSILGGMVVGSGFGFVLSRLLLRVTMPALETASTAVLAYGTYIVATVIGGSGIIAVATAGLVFGTYGRRHGLSPAARETLDTLWSLVASVANALLFFFIGLTISLSELWNRAGYVAVAVIVVLVARAAIAYSVSMLMPRVSLRHGHVLFWGSIRGGVAIAVALSLPASVPDGDLIRTLTFGVVLFTILVQGSTIEPLTRRLHLRTHEAARAMG